MKKLSIIIMTFVLLFTAVACSSSASDNEAKGDADTFSDTEYNTGAYYEDTTAGGKSDGEIQDDYETKSNGELLFNTEYTVKDYCEGAIIVSKLDGKLYGLLDDRGKEILPLDYDSLSFVNKDKYIDGEENVLYLIAEREEYDIIFNVQGNEIFRSDKNLSIINFELDCDADGDSPYYFDFVAKTDTSPAKTTFYNKDGKVISEVSYSIAGSIMLSNKAFVTYNLEEFAIYNYNGDELQRIKKTVYYVCGTKSAYYLYLKDDYNDKSDKCEEVVLDADGNIVSRGGSFSSYDIGKKQNECRNEKEEADKKYNLYKSNDTWKLEDLKGNTLYEERYFDKVEFDNGENDCIGLVNGENTMCIIGKTGKMYVDFGTMEYVNKKILLISGEEKREVKEIFEGKESVIITIKSGTGYDIYYYNGN